LTSYLHELKLASFSVQQAFGGTVTDPVTGNTIETTSLATIGVRDLALTVHFAPVSVTPPIGGPGPVSPVPEPATWGMLLGGIGALALLRRRRT